MTSWHVPVHEETVVTEDDAFVDEALETTFPPLRYFPVFYDRQIPIAKPRNVRRESSRERERLYKELVGHDPYSTKPPGGGTLAGGKKDGFYVRLDVKHYKPEEITLKVEGQLLEVKGKHRNEADNGYDASEFHRRYTIPEKVDPRSLTSSISQEGILCIEANTPPSAPQTIEEEGKENFVFSLDVDGYKPDEITIHVSNKELIIHGETKVEDTSEHGTHTHLKQFTRQISLPADIDVNMLSSRYKECKLTVEAPRNNVQESLRKIEVTLED